MTDLWQKLRTLINKNRFIAFSVLIAITTLFVMMADVSHPAIIYHVPGDYDHIQWAVDNATPGDTVYVHAGTYAENVVLDRAIYLIGVDMPVIDAGYAGPAVRVVSDDCLVQGFHLTNFDYGIDMGARDCFVRDNVIDSGYTGIYLNAAESCTIYNNTVSSSNRGICLEIANDNVIDNNTAHDNYMYGIYLTVSDGNTIRNNTCYGNGNIEAGGGIYLSNSAVNVLYFNDLGDTRTAIDNSPGNFWYNISQQRGNLYADYAGADGNGDGVGDTPYDIPGFMTQDLYPLMRVQPPMERTPVVSSPGNSTPTSTSVSVFWTTDMASDNVVLFGTDPGLAGAAWSAWDNGTESPSILLDGLAPGTVYYYQCYAYNPDDLSLYTSSETLSFTTVRNPKTWTVDDDGGEMPGADFEKIQDAVNASIDGDSVLIYYGLYEENVIVDRRLAIAGVPDAGGYLPEIRGDMRNGSSVSLKASGCRLEGINVTRVPYFVYYRDHDSGLSLGYTDYRYFGGAWRSFDYASDDNVVLGCNFDDSGIYAVQQSDNNTVAGCSFTASIVTLQFAKDNRFTGCAFREGSGVRMRSLDSIDSFPFLKDEPFNNTIAGCSFADSEVDIGPYANDNNLSYNTMRFAELDDDLEGISVLSSGRTRLLDNTIDGAGHGTGILVRGNDTYLSGNTVWSMGKGISIISQVGTWVNTTMRDNRIGGCAYDFVLDPGTYGSYSRPWPANFYHDIDPSNRVDGKRIYFIRNASDAVYDGSVLPDAGFLALADCRNVTVRGLAFEGNSHGLLLFNVSDSTLSDIAASFGYLDGIAIYNSSGVKVNGPTLTGNGGMSGAAAYSGGLLLAGCSGVAVDGGSIENNGRQGIRLDYSDGCTINNSTLLYNGHNDYYSFPSGIYMNYASEGVICGNNITALVEGRQRYGIYLDESSGNLICNNSLSNPVNARESLYYGGSNRWNVTKTPGINILGGPFLGGNAWSDYAGNDIDGDWLGDEGLPFTEYGNISVGGDFRPLILVPDTTAPDIVVVSPEQGAEYEASYVYLDVFSPDADVAAWWYSLSGGANVSFVPNATVQGLATGSYTLAVYANDTSGNVNLAAVGFTVALAGDDEGPPLEEVPDDEVDFAITLISPNASEQENRSVLLDYSAPVPLKNASYILDGSRPVKLSPMDATVISRLGLGEHSLIVNGEDAYGLKGKARFNFTVTPLLLYDTEEGGTPGFPDDAAYEFLGRNTSYTLRFEAYSAEGNVSVYVNRMLGGTPGDEPLIVDLYGPGALLANVTPPGSWAAYEMAFAGDVVAPDEANLVSYVHEINPLRNDSLAGWGVRNVTLRPEDRSRPWIEAFVDPQAISDDGPRKVYVSVEGAAADGNYTAYLYLAGPDGRKRYYPAWGETPVPLDERYLDYSYYGRLPSPLVMGGLEPGTYALAGQIVDEDAGDTLSAGAKHVYYHTSPAVKLYVNREMAGDGATIALDRAVTGSGGANGTLIVSLKGPDGSVVYLPGQGSNLSGEDLVPLTGSYERAYEGTVDSSWAEGTYLAWAVLYGDEGSPLSEDFAMFEVRREAAILRGNLTRNESSPIVKSRVRLTDVATMATFQVENDTYGQSRYSIMANPGHYYLSAELFDEEGYIYIVPASGIELGPGDYNRHDLKARRTGPVFVAGTPGGGAPPLGGWSAVPGLIARLALPRAEAQGACSVPRVILDVTVNTEVVAALLQEYPNDTPETIKRYFELRLREDLAQGSPGVEINTYGDVGAILNGQEAQLEEDPGAIPDGSRINEIMNTDYILRMRLSKFGDTCLATGSLIDVNMLEYDAQNIVALSRSRTGSSASGAVDAFASSIGDLGLAIAGWETANPLPPRDPAIAIAMTPANVSYEQGRNTLTIRATVTDCHGSPVEGAKVYFREDASRGSVVAEHRVKGGARSYGYGYSVTGSDGSCTATYTLTKGASAGEDTVDLFTPGRGPVKPVHKTAKVKINGFEVEAWPDMGEIGPQDSTTIRARLYETDAQGNRQPLAGKSLIVESLSLVGGRLTVDGPSDGYGNPVTDASGTATVRYTSSVREGLAQVRFKYYPLNDELVEDTAQVRVKAERYLIKVSWSASGASSESTAEEIAGSVTYADMGYSGSWNYHYQHALTRMVGEDFASTTRYYLASSVEFTTGRLNGMKQEDGAGSGGWDAVASDDDGWSYSASSSGAAYNNMGLTYNAGANEYPTKEAILHTNDTSRTFWIMLTPLPVAMDYSSTTRADRGVSWSEQMSSTGPGGSWSYTEGGGWSHSDSKTDTGRMSPAAMSNVPPDFFTLTKKGKDTYEFDYRYQNAEQGELVEERSHVDEHYSVSGSITKRHQSDFVKVITIRMVKV